MNVRTLLDTEITDHKLHALIALSQTTMGRIAIAAASEAEEARIRSVLTGQVHGVALGDVISFNGAPFRVVSRSQFQALVESLEVQDVTPVQGRHSKPAFGRDRPYLKKKKGRS